MLQHGLGDYISTDGIMDSGFIRAGVIPVAVGVVSYVASSMSPAWRKRAVAHGIASGALALLWALTPRR